jgi:hypothetical protein
MSDHFRSAESLTLTTDSIHPLAAIFLPVHTVISWNGAEIEIDMQNRVQVGPEPIPSLFGPVMEIRAQISEAVEAIAMRKSLVV